MNVFDVIFVVVFWGLLVVAAILWIVVLFEMHRDKKKQSNYWRIMGEQVAFEMNEERREEEQKRDHSKHDN